MACMDFNEFNLFIVQFNQAVEIDKAKDKPLRYDVWATTSEQVSALTDKLQISALPDTAQSLRISTKIQNALNRVKESSATGGTVQKDIFDHKFNKEMSIALHELMESVKGEADKARNKGIEIQAISDSGVLPALPMSRVAASIGRKIAFQKGYRFKRAVDEDTAARIEALYYDLGREAISQLEQAGYAKSHTDIATIMDYQEKSDLKKDFPKNELTRSDQISVSLDEKKLGVKPDTPTSTYFLNRSDSNLDDTDLGVVTDKLRAVNMTLQPATFVMPDEQASLNDEELAQWDDGVRTPDPTTEKVRKEVYKKPLTVNQSLTGFIELLNEEQQRSGKSASKRLQEIFGNRKNMIRSLFGLKRSDDFSIDKKESVGGQNLSKTTPLDDIVEFWDLLKGDLHMPMKIGRNARLYYLNSVLNAHGSKQSRYLLTPGEYTVDIKSDDYDYLVYQISESLKFKDPITKETVQYSYADITKSGAMDPALDAYTKFAEANTLRAKTQGLAALARLFPGVDYVTIATSLQAAQDVRSAKEGKVTTEFPVSADATASGGTLTFMQALGTNPKVTEFLQRIGLLKPDTLVKKNLNDLYQLMSESITAFVRGDPGSGLGGDLGDTDVSELLQDTLDMLFNEGKDIRELSKDPTMTFVYGQGKKAAIETMSRALADRMIDNLDDPLTRGYLAKLFKDSKYKDIEGEALKLEKGLYPDIVRTLSESGLPGTLYDIMQDNIKEEFLGEYLERSQAIYDIVKQLPADTPFKILPAGAVLAGIEPTMENLQKYGMPITKEVEVLNTFKGKEDTVLTRREKLQKTVMDVSTVHGVDAALMYHSIDKVGPKDGVVVIHDDVRGSVKTVRAMEKAYADTAVDIASKYDIHQQILLAAGAYSTDVANSPEYKSLKKQIDKNVAEKQRIMTELFNSESTALIGDGDAFKRFANPAEVDTAVEDTVQSNIPNPEQDFGDTTVTITEGSTSVEVLAQEYWNSLQSRLNMVDQLRTCLAAN